MFMTRKPKFSVTESMFFLPVCTEQGDIRDVTRKAWKFGKGMSHLGDGLEMSRTGKARRRVTGGSAQSAVGLGSRKGGRN